MNEKDEKSIQSFEELRKQLGLDDDGQSVSMLEKVLDEKNEAVHDDEPSQNDENSIIDKVRRVDEQVITAIEQKQKQKTKKEIKAEIKAEKANQKQEKQKAKALKAAQKKENKAEKIKEEKPSKPKKEKNKDNKKKKASAPVFEAPVIERKSAQAEECFEKEKTVNPVEQQETETVNEITATEENVVTEAAEEVVQDSNEAENIDNILMYEYDPEGAVKNVSGFKKFLTAVFPVKRDSGKEKARKLVSILSVLIILGCVGYFGVLRYQKTHSSNQIQTLHEYITELPDGETEEEAWKRLRKEYPNTDFPVGMQVRYAKLYAINNEFIGWLTVPNTQINVQVVKAQDNEKYLKQDFYGNYSRYGCPFMDYRDNIRTLSLNTVIYGHHMKDGLMFAELSKYLNIEGFKESPTIQLSTLYGDYVFKIYAVFITNSEPVDDNGYVFNYIFTHLTNDEAFSSYVKALDERKLYDTGVDIEPGDKLITLSTCTYEFDNARLVVVGRLVRENESTTVRVNKAELNENPRYPNVWYTKNKTDNPFLEADKWYPS